MVTQAGIADFLSCRKLALAGLSRRSSKFGNMAYKELRAKGYEIFPIHPQAEEIRGIRCWPGLKDLPEPVEGVVIILPPAQTERVIQEAAEAGIKHIWIQQGAESEASLEFCRRQGMAVVHGQCILMFAEPLGLIHRVHRWFWRLRGKLPG
jgi:predicted CoA-binding protein